MAEIAAIERRWATQEGTHQAFFGQVCCRPPCCIPARSLPVPLLPSAAARDHHGLTGCGTICDDVPWHATTQTSPASTASGISGTIGGVSYTGATGGGASLVYTGNSAALMPKRFNAAASPCSAACFCSLFKS